MPFLDCLIIIHSAFLDVRFGLTANPSPWWYTCIRVPRVIIRMKRSLSGFNFKTSLLTLALWINLYSCNLTYASLTVGAVSGKILVTGSKNNGGLCDYILTSYKNHPAKLACIKISEFKFHDNCSIANSYLVS